MDQNKSLELIENFITVLRDKLGTDDYEISPGRVEKLTGSYDSVMIFNKKTKVGGNVDRQLVISLYEQGQCLERIAEYVIENMVDEVLSVPIETDWILQYDKVKDLLFVRLSNRTENAQLLSVTPHKDLPGDLAATVHIYVEVEYGFGSVIVSQECLKSYGMTFDELYEAAIENGQKIMPVIIATLDETIGVPEVDHACTGVVMTNEKQINGSAVILYPDVLEKAWDYFKEDYWLFPSSIHEMIAFRVSSMSEERARAILRNANKTVVAGNEKLSDVLYIYHHETGTFEPVEEKSEE